MPPEASHKQGPELWFFSCAPGQGLCEHLGRFGQAVSWESWGWGCLVGREPLKQIQETSEICGEGWQVRELEQERR